MVKDIDKDEMLKRFALLGKHIAKAGKGERFEIYLFGSGLGMYHMERNYRVSADIDFQSNSTVNSTELMDYLDMLDIHEIGGIIGIPPLDEVDVAEKLEYGNGSLIVYIPSIEDFALTKLLSDRIKDADDLKKYPILENCDIAKPKDMLNDYIKYIPFENTSGYNFNFLDEFLASRGIEVKENMK